MANKISEDPRIDPRIKALFGAFEMPAGGDVESREALLEATQGEEAQAAEAALKTMLDACDNEQVAPSEGLEIKDFERLPEVSQCTTFLNISGRCWRGARFLSRPRSPLQAARL